MSLRYLRPVILKDLPHDRHAVIEAGAGTGKTYAIEYLVLDLLLNTESSIEEILVVTFTEKATAELRTRIRNLIETVVVSGSASIEDRPGTELVEISDEGKRKLETALFFFDRAPICTIHAFCRRVLTDLAFDAGAAFGLEVVDAHKAFHRAFRSTLREVLAVQSSTRELLDEWMTDGETARQPNQVDSLEGLLRDAHFNRYLQSGAREQNEQAIGKLTETFDAGLLSKLGNRNRKAAPIVLNAINGLAEAVSAAGMTGKQLNRAFGNFKEDFFSNLAVKTIDAKERRQLDVLLASRAACSLDTRVVDTFLPLVAERLRCDKRQNREIDYGDMLEEVWQALASGRGPSLLALLRARFRYGLVDEFQDTDDLQWRIFQRIFLHRRTGNVLYVVGDPKQAIYSFRGADVFTYMEARDEILKSGGATVRLIENHRSTAELIGALNLILDQRASPPLFSGAIRYDHPVVCGRPDLRARDANGTPVIPVTLLKYSPSNPPASVARLRASVGRHIATEIHRIITDPDSAIFVKDDKESRRVEAKDIFILTRTGAEATEIGGYLREQGVPFAFYKKDGLFQTSEAYDVLDILNAIEEPDSQTKRLKAWISPFFAVPYQDLFGRTEAPADHELNERLYQWKALADEERFEELFDQLVHRSGLVGRELFLSNNERELTNYLHIFEILLEQRLKEGLSLGELIGRLEAFIAETALPAGIDSNIQRIESERSAVQIMSVHMSKGLQADVVFLFGGSVRPNILPRLWVYHDEKGERRATIGKAGRALARTFLDRETREENERLTYVAITRARAKVYLPVYPDQSTKVAVNGYYEALNDRLKVLADDLNRGTISPKLMEEVRVRDRTYDPESVAANLERKIATWLPPKSILNRGEAGKSAKLFDDLRVRSRPMLTRSYTSLESRRQARDGASDLDVQEFKYDLDAPVEGADLKGGRRIGIFLHEVIEKLDLESFNLARDVGAWRQLDVVKRVFADAMRRHQVADDRWFERGTEIVFNSLTSRIAIAPARMVGPLYKCPNVREMEFVYPIPERTHALLESAGDGRWSVARGYLKGFVDFVFEYEGKHYFADWKSDALAAYDLEAIAPHVKDHYDLQAKIYSVGIVRLLAIRDEQQYNERFGGLLYLFIRGLKRDGAGDAGVYFHRPDWAEICRSERELIGAVPGMSAIQ